jgi:hypothetical protein
MVANDSELESRYLTPSNLCKKASKSLPFEHKGKREGRSFLAVPGYHCVRANSFNNKMHALSAFILTKTCLKNALWANCGVSINLLKKD